MSERIFRKDRKTDPRGDIRIQVRFKKELFDQILEYCDNECVHLTELMSISVRNQLKLKKFKKIRG